MRGYEISKRTENESNKYRYESPCGVMSAQSANGLITILRLRIPMRGYEIYA